MTEPSRHPQNEDLKQTLLKEAEYKKDDVKLPEGMCCVLEGKYERDHKGRRGRGITFS